MTFKSGGSPIGGGSYPLYSDDFPSANATNYISTDVNGWSNYNSGGALTFSDADGLLKLTHTSDGTELRGKYLAVPGTDYTIAARLTADPEAASDGLIALALFEDATDTSKAIHYVYLYPEISNIQAARYSNHNTYAALYGSAGSYTARDVLLLIEKNGTDFRFAYQTPGLGKTIITLYNSTISTTVSHWGIVTQCGGSGKTSLGYVQWVRTWATYPGYMGTTNTI